MNILIFGENSYIGNAFEAFVYKKHEDELKIIKVSSRSGVQKDCFSEMDCVLFCAGIAHRKAGKDLHYKINRDLAVKAAEEAKAQGVKHFVYLSSAAVFGKDNISATGEIVTNINPKPDSFYGKSKLEAEERLKKLEDSGFTVTVIRPPMVYGFGCKGNFPRLVKLALSLPFFPEIESKRSMIFIDNLSFFLIQVIKAKKGGVYFPQNAEHVCTSRLVGLIAETGGRKIRFVKIFNPFIRLFMAFPQINKLFGSLVYTGSDFEMVNKVSLKESVELSLKKLA